MKLNVVYKGNKAIKGFDSSHLKCCSAHHRQIEWLQLDRRVCSKEERQSELGINWIQVIFNVTKKTSGPREQRAKTPNVLQPRSQAEEKTNSLPKEEEQ